MADSDDDMPLAQRMAAPAMVPAPVEAASPVAAHATNGTAAPSAPASAADAARAPAAGTVPVPRPATAPAAGAKPLAPGATAGAPKPAAKPVVKPAGAPGAPKPVVPGAPKPAVAGVKRPADAPAAGGPPIKKGVAVVKKVAPAPGAGPAAPPRPTTAPAAPKPAGAAPAGPPKPKVPGAPATKPGHAGPPKPGGGAAVVKPGVTGAPKPVVPGAPKPAGAVAGGPKPAAGGVASTKVPAGGAPANGAKPAAARPPGSKPGVAVVKKIVKAPPPPPPPKAAAKPVAKRSREDEDDDDDDDDSSDDSSDENGSGSDGDDLAPLAKKTAKPASEGRRGGGGGGGGAGGDDGGRSRGSKKREIKWTNLEHKGVLFPPAYSPHGVPVLWQGEEVEMSPAAEELATLYVGMLETDYASKEDFLKNFWKAWKKALPGDTRITDLQGVDFTRIVDHHKAVMEARKAESKETKKARKAAKDAEEAPYKFATVTYPDGKVRKEGVGNINVEPPGLFRGRGKHPKMGCFKRRIMPEDVTLNLGEAAPVPPCPLPGHKWGGVVHDPTVTWLATWRDPVDAKSVKYVYLAANSTFKADSDIAKYEKARELHRHIETIRADYTRKMRSKSASDRQLATATYLIDKLALRAGGEKDEDEADTVGCCSLRTEHIKVLPDNQIRFWFLGKDSMVYDNLVTVTADAHANLKEFRDKSSDGKKKKVGDVEAEVKGDALFDDMGAGGDAVSCLNAYLKSHMAGLSAKVFRTYNASITLERLLEEETARAEAAGEAVVAGQAEKHVRDVCENVLVTKYTAANKEVAILCNHQRSVPKAHGMQMEKMEENIKKQKEKIEKLKAEKKDLTSASTVLEKMRLNMENKEAASTVSLGTSKINYMDPRITIAWCKRSDVKVEKVFNRSLITKFNWAMEVEPEWRFKLKIEGAAPTPKKKDKAPAAAAPKPAVKAAGGAAAAAKPAKPATPAAAAAVPAPAPAPAPAAAAAAPPDSPEGGAE